MLIDIGANLASHRFDGDLIEVLGHAKTASIERIIITGTSLQESQAALDLCTAHAEQFPQMLYATAGIHPHSADQFDPQSIASLRSIAEHPAVVAIGETGLDFYRNLASPEIQQRSFEAHLELAIELKMPLFLHERNAATRQLEILKTYRDEFGDAVIHCFTGDRKTLYKYLDMDLHIGITGWICDEKRGLELQRIVADIPLDRLMIESDSPYLLPRNMAFSPKNNRNEPAFLPWVVTGLAAHRPETESEIIAKSGATAKNFFTI
ncbi:MAG: TatD family hydrolase [Porticoccaceae bacterium]|nr:TatD family hydrolase [Porticoccaceae bacterium]